jgi:hypothetical protein
MGIRSIVATHNLHWQCPSKPSFKAQARNKASAA